MVVAAGHLARATFVDRVAVRARTCAPRPRERSDEIEGWPVDIVSYRIGDRWYCRIHNPAPGGVIERGTGTTREEAEDDAVLRVRPRLATTRRMKDAIADLRHTVAELDTTLREKA